MWKIFGSSLVLLTALAGRSEAQYVQYAFTGHVTGSSFPGQNVGDAVRGFFTYSNNRQGVDDYSYTTSYYATSLDPTTISFTTKGETIALTQNNGLGAESVTNDFHYVLGISVRGGPAQDDPFLRILFSRNPGNYGSRALPSTLKLSDFSGVQLGYFQGNTLFAALDTLQAVPEPKTFVMFSIGMFGLTFCRRKWRVADAEAA